MFTQVIITKEIVLLLVKNPLSPSISVGGRSGFLPSYTLCYKWHILQTFSRTSLPSHVPLYSKYEALDVEGPSMMWITVHLHQRCCQDTPSITTISLKKGTEGPIFLTDHPLREVK